MQLASRVSGKGHDHDRKDLGFVAVQNENKYIELRV